MTNSPDLPAGVAPRPRPDLRTVEPAAAPGDRAAEAEAAEAEARAARRRAAKAARAAARAEPGAAEAPSPIPVEAGQRVRPATPRVRHWMALASFFLLVVLPLGAVAGYLYTRAADQYHSEVAFSIRSEEAGSAAAGLLGTLTKMGSGSASDPDILAEYIRSQQIVEAIDADLDLRAIYNRAEDDPFFTLGAAPSIEALVRHWRRMVDIAFESSTGIIHVRANAFTPDDARAIARAILAESSALVNQLSVQAREDAVRFAREALDEAEVNVRTMRQRLAGFRRAHNIVDPTADVAGQMGLLSALQAELAQALVDRDVLTSFATEGDQRVIQANRRIEAITARIEDERSSLDLTGVAGSLPDVVGAYEELLVDLEFANTAYTQALAGLAAARAESRRQSRYLAPHIQPTQAESALYPRRAQLTALAGLFLLLGWGVLMLVYYNVRDSR